MCRYLLIAILSMLPIIANSQSINPREGWFVFPTQYSFKELVNRTRAAVKIAPIAIVSQASASSGAHNQGFEIPGNRVIGIYRNDYARRMLAASVAAGVEAPIRLYLTENEDETATLSYKTPSSVFAPYMDEGGEDLQTLAVELDAIFLGIARSVASDP
jgi:uncharacterized protein (DUF302 family)